MAGNIQPLDQKFPIVAANGTPTMYFIQWAQQKQIDISDAITAEQAVDIIVQYLADHELHEGSGIQITPSGNLSDSPTIAADVQEILDQITTVRGTILYRGLLGWSALAPGLAGYFLTTGGPGTDPSWAPGGGGGGGANVLEIAVTKPVAASFSLVGGGAGISFADGAFGPVLYRDGTTGALTTLAIYNVAPGAAAFTLTARLRAPDPQYSTGYSACLVLRNSSNGRHMIWGNFSNDNNQLCQTWSAGAAVTNIFNLPSNPFSAWPWRRIVLAAGVLTFYMSVDGDSWYPVQTTTTVAAYLTAAGGTLDQVGFGAYNKRGGSICQSLTLV